MIYTQTSNEPLPLRDTTTNTLNVFVKIQAQESSLAESSQDQGEQASRPISYLYASYLHKDTDFATLSLYTLHTLAYQEARAQANLELEILKALKLAQINAKYDMQVEVILAQTPQGEVQSWATQEAEAQAYLANQSAQTPYLDALCQARGLDKQTLAQKVLEKAQTYREISASFTAQRQKLEDKVKQAQSLQDLDAIIILN